MLRGDPLATARAISAVENREKGSDALLAAVSRHAGKAHRIGIAGPPGAGKSTLVGALIEAYRKRGTTVGVLATDPSSQLTGGAILGDRVRIREFGSDTGVFYRSMATRGYRGGLSGACRDTIRILEASGKEIVLVETVGIGQAELDITTIVDTLVLVLVPESGDFIQMLKAGILEFGDILVVNKADRAGADDVASDLTEMLHLRAKAAAWQVPVLKTVARAREGEGIAKLMEALDGHAKHLKTDDRLRERRQEQVLAELRERILEEMRRETDSILSGPDAVEWVSRVRRGKSLPSEVARKLRNHGQRKEHKR